MAIGDTNYGTLRQRQGTPASLSSSNPVLAFGEFTITYDGTTPVLKIGDGVRAWNDLPNLAGGGTGGGGDVDIAYVLNRDHHTGTQPQATIDGLVSALAALAPKASPTFTGTVTGVTKTMVGLGNVDDTSDADKPVSTLQADAILESRDRGNHTGTMPMGALDSGTAADGLVVTTDGAGGVSAESIGPLVAEQAALISPYVNFSAPVATVNEPSGTDEVLVARTLEELRMRTTTAPVGSALTVIVETSTNAGASFTTVATLTIAAGTTTAVVDTAVSQAQPVGMLMRCRATSVGSTTPAKGVVVTAVFR